MRSPGLLTRFSPVITGRRSLVYFSVIRIESAGSLFCTSKSRMKPSRFKLSAIAIFIFDAGMATVVWRAIHALRMRVSISAIGSLTLTTLLLEDQLQLWAGIGTRPLELTKDVTSWTW